MSLLVEAVEAVETTVTWDAKKRIPEKYYGVVTFFSDYDLWRWEAIMDDRICPTCSFYERVHYFVIGSKVRLLFPYLEILDENTIKPNAHQHCRCLLHRASW